MASEHPVTLGERYELGDVIGRGGMADVHRATDRLLSREVAVKVLRDTAESDDDRRRFTSEATTLARLSHHGLVMVLDAGITVERPYLVMELVDGPTLSQVGRDGPVDPARVRDVGAQLADALAYAHEQGVVHRDVKPGNVLLGESGRVKLADFGIARLIGDTVRHTRTGHAIGTPAYLAPEQVRGDPITTAVDVYSLGLVLLEALTGERAYPGSPTEAALVRLSRPPYVPESLPEEWRALLTAMTAMAPADRPSAAEVAAELRAPADATRTFTRPVPLSVVARRVPPHLRGVIAAVAAIVALIVVAALASGGGGSSDEQPPANTPQQAKRTKTPEASSPKPDEAEQTEATGPAEPAEVEPAGAPTKQKEPKKDKKQKHKHKGKGKKH